VTHLATRSQGRELRRISLPKRDEIVGCRGKLHGVDLHNFVLLTKYYLNQDSSGGVVLGYGLDGPSLSPISARVIFSL
jgi:hypothetical protein